MPATLSPSPWFTGLDNSGNPLSGGLLYVYLAGTTTPSPAYTDVGLTVPHPNPVVLDSAGRATLYLDALSYKYVLRTAAGALIRTQDDITSTGVGQSDGIGETFIFGGDSSSPIVDVAYPSGSDVADLHAGSAIMELDSTELVGDYVLEAMMLATVGPVVCALVNLSDGSPDVPLVTVESESITGERVRSDVITFAAAGSSKQYGIKVLCEVGTGYVWQVKLIREES